jgi:hypothetical protein
MNTKQKKSECLHAHLSSKIEDKDKRITSCNIEQ